MRLPLLGKIAGWIKTGLGRVVGIARMRPGISRSAALMAVLLSITVLFVGLFYVWTRMQIVQVGYEISALKSKSRDLKNRKRELELEIASLQSPRELEKKALKLGLVSPAMRSVVHVP